MGTQVDVSIIIIEYFSINDIIACIKSIEYSCTHIPHEIIISSNSCYNPEVQNRLLQDYPTVKWQFNTRNGGFAYGMNRGLEIASGKYLVIANPDSRIISGFDRLIKFMDNNEQIGAAGPQIINSKGEIQDSCRNYVSIQGLIYRTVKRILSHKEIVLSNSYDYSRIQTVDWLIGAFMIVRHEVFNRIGGLDETYFMYAEDIDWCTRIRLSGYEIAYYPLMKVEYEGSRSARKSVRFAKIFIKSHIHYWRKFGFFYGYPHKNNIILHD